MSQSKGLQCSLITSFVTDGFLAPSQTQLRNELRTHCNNIELYTFMHSELAELFGDVQNEGRPTSALYRLAAANLIPRMEAITAEKLHKRMHGLNIVAFATFLPEITAHEANSDAYKRAQAALIFLVKVARILRRDYGHSINTIELVGGSSVDGVWKGLFKTDKLNTYVVNRMPPRQSIDRLVRRLQPVAEEALKDSPINLALELEPGPLFNISNQLTLNLLCESLESSTPEIKRVLGLNLDIPHWGFLSDITPNWVRKNPDIMKRIVHAHICDHYVGHFCDSVPGAFHVSDEFEPWIKLIKEIHLGNLSGSLGFSGFLSCELECSQNKSRMHKALEVVKKMI